MTKLDCADKLKFNKFEVAFQWGYEMTYIIQV